MTAAWAKRLRGAHLGAWYVLATALVLVAIGTLYAAWQARDAYIEELKKEFSVKIHQEKL